LANTIRAHIARAPRWGGRQNEDNMKITLVLAAGVVLASASAAFANDVQFTFADANGVPYCDGLQLTELDGVAQGVHTNGADCTEGAFAGGLQGHYHGYTGHRVTAMTTDPNLPNVIEMYLLDQLNMTWSVYDMDTADNEPFELVNSGVLLDGSPAAQLRRTHHAFSGRKP
jgi:hypothetical protein